MPAVVDTCVVSFLFRGGPQAALYRPHLVGNIPVISFMTLAELYRWPLERGWGATRRRNLDTYLRRRYVVYPFNRALCQQWAEATDGARRNGYTVPVADGWIAATALLYGIPLITNNPRHYEGIPGLRVITEAP
jgi:tRNA(fMet)-specific endonuclease VapC